MGVLWVLTLCGDMIRLPDLISRELKILAMTGFLALRELRSAPRFLQAVFLPFFHAPLSDRFIMSRKP